MTTQPPSHQKIMFLLAFLCAGIMASLFVYRISHQEMPTVLVDGEATLFKAPRDIKDFELITSHNKPFTQKNLIGRWSMLFFGFTHCATICPATLTKLDLAHPKLHSLDPRLQIVFISLDPERDSLAKLNQFLGRYRTDFIGVTGKIQNVRKLQSQFGIYAEPDTKTAGDNYQLIHTASIILIDPRGRFAGIFSADIKPEQLVEAFKAVLS